MAFILRRVITHKVKCIKELKPKINFSVIGIQRSRALHQSAICQTDKDVIIQLLKQEVNTELVKEPKKKPYIKNLMLSKLEKDLLVYPQVVPKNKYIFLEEMVGAVETYFAKEVDGNIIDQSGEVPECIVKDMKALGLFGLIIPTEYGGLGFSQTEFCRIAEQFAVNPSISLTLIAHQCLAAKAIMEYGTEEQKNKYLPAMATGEKIGAFCFTEESGGSDPGSLKCKLDVDKKNNSYFLNGTKTWVTNGKVADIFIVIANELVDSISNQKLTAVIVENIDKNLTIEKQSTLGMKGANIAKVKFNNIYLTQADLLGESRAGLEITLDVYNLARIGVGAICTGLSKHLIEICTDHINTRTMYDMEMAKLANVREKIVYMTGRTYGMESFTYFVASLEDVYDNQDYFTESACLKVMSTSLLVENVESVLKILASKALESDGVYERHIRDAISLTNFLGSNDVINLVIALDCLQYCGSNMSTLVLKKRKYLEHPRFNLKETYRKFIKYSRNEPTLDMEMHYLLHPMLDKEAKDLEGMLVYLSHGIEKSLVFFGNKVASEQHQYVTSRIGSSTSIILMLLSSLSRSSRSICLGMPDADVETRCIHLLFSMYEQIGLKHIKDVLTGIDALDINEVHDLSNKLVDGKKYILKSPVFRFVW